MSLTHKRAFALLFFELSELTENMVAVSSRFSFKKTSSVEIQGEPISIKYGHIMYIRFGMHVNVSLSKGTILADVTPPKHEVLNIPIYNNDGTAVGITIKTDGSIITNASTTPKGAYFVEFLCEC